MKHALIINSNIELIDALETLFQEEGYVTHGFQIKDLKMDIVNIDEKINEYAPQLILYDVSIPYDENWKYFLSIKADFGNKAQVIVTTTNKRALERLVGPTPTVEIVEKPFSINELLGKIKSTPAYTA